MDSLIANMDCREKIAETLAPLPPSMRESLTNSICEAFGDRSVDCKGCETVKKVSPFYISFDGVCLSFRDENGVYFTRCFCINGILKNLTDDVDPGVIMSQEDWTTLGWLGRIQAIINYRCNCSI